MNKVFPESLFNKRLLVVSGKGGVGKTSISLALGLLAVQRGKKVLIAELNSEEQVAHLLEHPPVGHHEIELLPGLWDINIHPLKSFEEYVLTQIKFRTLYKAVFENRLVRNFIEATPGLADLMSIGKIYSMVDQYDLVIVDAPATGHGIALLEIPSIVSRAVRLGPLKTESDKISELILDQAKTELVLVTLPEELPVTEAIEMSQSLMRLPLPVGMIFLNQVHSFELTPSEKRELSLHSLGEGGKIIEWQIDRTEAAASYRERLAEEIPERPIISLPFIYSSHFGLTEIEILASAIENATP